MGTSAILQSGPHKTGSYLTGSRCGTKHGFDPARVITSSADQRVRQRQPHWRSFHTTTMEEPVSLGVKLNLTPTTFGQPSKVGPGEQSNSLPPTNTGTCTFGPTGNGLQTGSEVSGLSSGYSNPASCAGSERASRRGPASSSTPVPSGNPRPLRGTMSNGRDPRRASKR
uniref:Uncharacterized protein n=1 Tax=Sphaerodactylus townsendi TaxID=933632 RepID=A0ACB8FZY7_9SAUR